jgi:hydroxyethylthiazole kinase
MTPTDFMTPASLAATLTLLRTRRPLVHNLTNAVVANFTANALLALGAAPAMAEGADEVAEFAAAADAVVINLGMLSPERAAVMRVAAVSAAEAGRPWALDPVGVGAIPARTRFAQELCRLRPTAIRGNASEILALAGEAGGGRGVDSGAQSEAAVAAARRLAGSSDAIVAVTGAVDYVTDGVHVLTLHNGHELMTRVTGMGCAATAIVGACLAVDERAVDERAVDGRAPGGRTRGDGAMACVAHALAITGIAGEMAALTAHGSGSMMVAFLDALGALDSERLRVG